MKRKLSFILAFCILGTSLWAEISKKQLAYQSVDYIICKVVEISLKNSGESAIYADYRKQCPCELGGDDVTFEDVQLFLKSKKVNLTLKLAEQINKVKNSYYSEIPEKELTEYLTFGIFDDDSVPMLRDFKNNPKHATDVSSLMTLLREDLGDFIARHYDEGFAADAVPKSPPTVQNATPQTPVQEPTSTEEEVVANEPQGAVTRNKGFGLLGGLVSIALLLMGAILGVMFYRKNKMYNKLEERFYSLKAHATNLERMLAQKEGENANYRHTFEQKDSKIKELEQRLEHKEKTPASTMEWQDVGAASSTVAAYQKEEFYLSTPNKDGSFNDNGKSKVFKPTASLYHFTVMNRLKNTAEFEFVNDEGAVVRALNYPDTCLLPVCKEVNALNPNARGIQTVKKGVVQLMNDKWVLKEKAEIKYV